MTGTSTEIPERQVTGAIIAIALAGWLLRAADLATGGGSWAVRVDYDEGVYFSAASWLVRGLLPYRDFVFVHPPAFLYLLAPIAALGSKVGISAAFVAARWFATVLGAANIVLCAVVARRAAGPIAALVAAALYALYPEAVAVERGAFLEPALNLACLAAALLWTSDRPSSRTALWAGVLAGVAVAVKLWGGIWLVACLASAPEENRRAAVLRFCLGAGLAFAVLVGPLALLAPGAFWTDAVGFHLHRPPDHLASRLDRLGEVFSHRHAAAWILALLGVARGVVRFRSGPRGARLALVAYGLTLAAFFSARAFWSQYDAFLAPAEVVLAGVGAAWLWELAQPSGALAELGVGLVLFAGIGFAAAKTAKVNRNALSEDLPRAAEAFRKSVAPDACLLSLEPGWGLAIGRLPAAPQPWVDPYGRMLLESTRSGGAFTDVEQAFQSPESQSSVRASLAACRFAALGGRGRTQLSAETWDWLNAHWQRRYEGEPDLWEQTQP